MSISEPWLLAQSTLVGHPQEFVSQFDAIPQSHWPVKLLERDEVRRIAANIAKLPNLLLSGKGGES
jgi:hypothetical protein